MTELMVHDNDDLHAAWSTLIGDLGFDRRRLWLAFLEPSGRMQAALTQIEDPPHRATEHDCRAMLELCRLIVGDAGGGCSVALLLSRPGRHPINADDRSWASGLTRAAAVQQVALWPVYFANDAELVAFAPDDVLADQVIGPG